MAGANQFGVVATSLYQLGELIGTSKSGERVFFLGVCELYYYFKHI